jgi:UDP-N-acetylglucosamine--N-acetylmuramyl-(pentapeptide) pyrophosphoryl-undecaprenol N-acetylglucosamine transferase
VTKPIKILIVAGGTGGHLYPGIAVAQALWRAPVPDGGHRPDIRFVVRRGDLGKDILAREGFQVLEISGQGLPRQWNAATLKFPRTFYQSWRETFALLDQEQPDAVLGMGGYLSFPVLSAAVWRKIPTLIHEQNAVPGVANRLLARWVDSVAVSFPGSESYFPKQKVWLSGLPVRLAVQPASPAEARAQLGFKKEGIVFFAFGGSLGAHYLNTVLLEVWKRLLAMGKEFEVLHITGPRDFPSFESAFRESGIPGQALAYCHDMPHAYAAADLVISRSGASTIAELAAVQRPAILIPYPHATNDHQWANAQVLVRGGVAEALRESQLSVDGLLARLLSLINDPEKLSSWKKRCQKDSATVSAISPAVKIADYLLQHVVSK